MNTRLQVEHPVTELVTGLDLVEEMIRIAAGEKLALQQARRAARRLGDRGARLCGGSVPRVPAFDRAADALSPAGRRQDRATRRSASTAGVVEGSEISLFYDPMIAKLCTHAPDRAAAIDAMADALDAFAIDGIRHNIPFLAALMAHPRWREGRLSTAFIARGISRRLSRRDAGRGESRRSSPRSRSRRSSLAMRRPRPPKAQSVRDRAIRATGCSRSAASICRCEIAGRRRPARFDVRDRRAARNSQSRSDWRPGEPIWRGTVDGEPVDRAGPARGPRAADVAARRVRRSRA